MAIGIQDQYFGTEIEMTGITRQRAAEVVAEMFGTRAVSDGGYYGIWSVTDQEGEEVEVYVRWEYLYGTQGAWTHGSRRKRIQHRNGQSETFLWRNGKTAGSGAVSQTSWGEGKCILRAACACGRFPITHQEALKNAMTIMYSKEDILFKALRVQTSREQEYCQKVRPIVLEKIRRMPNSTISMEKLKRVWYEGRDGSNSHYDSTRYYALNLHAVFSKGTLEWRCFESTLHAGKVRANITLALAISAQAINQKCTQMRKTEITENPAFTFRTFLLRLGLIGPEYKNVREHLLANLEGDRAWRYDRSQYECLNRNHRAEDVR